MIEIWYKYLLFLLVCGFAIEGTGSEPPQPTTFDAFKIILERNIFDPNRSDSSVKSELPSKQPEVETATLVGILIYEKGPVAFLESANAELCKTVTEGGQFANCTVAKIFFTHVILNDRGKDIRWPVGIKICREDHGDWKLMEGSSVLAHNPELSDSQDNSPKRTKSKKQDIFQDVASLFETGNGDVLGTAYDKLMKKFNKRTGDEPKPEKQPKQNSADRSVKKFDKWNRKLGAGTGAE